MKETNLLSLDEKDESREVGRYQPAWSGLTVWAGLGFAVILGFARLSYGLLLPAIKADLVGSYSTFGLVGTANFVGYLAGTMALPPILRFFPRRQLLNGAALVAMSLALVGSALSFDPGQLAVWRAVIGFFSALTTVLTLSLTLERIEPSQRGQASGLIWMGGALGICVSGLLAPAVIGLGLSGSWRWVWVAMALAGMAATVGFWRVSSAPIAGPGGGPARQKARHSQLEILQRVFQPRHLLWLTISYFGFGCGYIVYFTFFISLINQQGVATLWTGLVWAVVGLVGCVSGWWWGRLIDQRPNGYVLAAGLGLGGLGTLSVLTGNLPLELAGAIIVGGGSFIGPPLIITALLKRAVPDDEYTSTFSFVTSIFAIGQIVGPVIGGSLIEATNLTVGVAVSAVFLIGGAFFAILFGRRKN